MRTRNQGSILERWAAVHGFMSDEELLAELIEAGEADWATAKELASVAARRKSASIMLINRGHGDLVDAFNAEKFSAALSR